MTMLRNPLSSEYFVCVCVCFISLLENIHMLKLDMSAQGIPAFLALCFIPSSALLHFS